MKNIIEEYGEILVLSLICISVISLFITILLAVTRVIVL